MNESVCASVVKVLGTCLLPDTPLMAAGLDSIAAIEFQHELGDTHGV
jgi:aryl carrier-like protein